MNPIESDLIEIVNSRPKTNGLGNGWCASLELVWDRGPGGLLHGHSGDHLAATQEGWQLLKELGSTP